LNIIETVRNIGNNIFKAQNGIKNVFLSNWQYNRELLTEDDKTKQLQAYKSWVYIFANKNAISVAQVPMRLYVAKPSKTSKIYTKSKPVDLATRKYLYANAGLDNYLRKAEDIEEIQEHRLLDLFKHVNPFMNQFELKEMTDLQQELCGNSYWYIANDQMGLPSQIFFVPPDKMKVIPDKKDWLKGYVFRNSSEEIYYKPEEIIHFKFPDPKNDYYGLSPVMALARTYNLIIDMEIYQDNFLDNQGIPSGILTSEANLTPDQIAQMSEQWNQKYMGTKKAGKTAFLGGGLKYTPITISPKDMGVLADDAHAKEKLCNAYGQSLGLYSENATEANATVAYKSFMRDAIRPRLRRMEQKINEQLCPRFDENIFIAFDNPVPEDRDYLLKKRDSDLNHWVMSINEVRGEEGKEPVQWGDKPIVPFNVMPFGTTASTGRNNNEPAKGKQKEPEDDEDSDAEKEKINNFRNLYWETFVKGIDPYENRFKVEVRTLFRKQEEKAQVLLQKGKSLTKDPIPATEIINLPTTDAELNAWAKATVPHITEVTKINGERALTNLGITTGFDVTNPLVVDFIKNHSGESIRQIARTTQEALRDTLFEGIQNGESIPKLSKRIAEVYQKAKDYRTDRIARTETATAANQGTLEAYKQSGVVKKKEWITADDERLCDLCAPMDGEVVNIDDNFSAGISAPPLHPNCRCTIVAAFEQMDKPPESRFTPASSIKEAEEYAKRFADNVSYQGLDLDVANSINKHILDMQEKYNLNKLKNIIAKNIRQLPPDVLGRAGYWPKELEFSTALNSKVGSKGYIDAYINNINNKYSAGGIAKNADDVINVIVKHEMAHLQFSTSASEVIGETVIRKMKSIKRAYVTALNKANYADDIVLYNKIKISDYATTNLDEFVAEAFVDYKFNKNPSKYSKDVYEVLKEIIENK
jgi:HK97 family phage portal protein